MPTSTRWKTVATLNPDHLFEQAEKLVEAPQAGPPRQVDVRRAISAAYYAVFHALLTAVADQFVGRTKRGTIEYALVYRSVSHGWLKSVCDGLKSSQAKRPFSQHAPHGGFGPDIQMLALAVLDLQEKRHSADYDPVGMVRTPDALLAIRLGRTALARFGRAPAANRTRFLALLAFPPR